MANDEVSREDELDSYRYGESDPRPFFLNWHHYLEAHKAILRFSEQHSADTPRDNSPRESVESVPSALPQIPEENRLLPIDGYFPNIRQQLICAISLELPQTGFLRGNQVCHGATSPRSAAAAASSLSATSPLKLMPA